MGIQNSNLNEDTIKRILEDNYNIETSKVTKIDRGTANIFEVQSKEKKYILKEFSEGRSEDSVIKETNIINFLKDRNIKVPVYIKSTQGNFYIKFEKTIRRRCICLPSIQLILLLIISNLLLYL